MRYLIEKTVSEVLKIEGFNQNVEISIVLMSNSGIRKINYAYRNINKPTDVLSFPMLEKADGTIVNPQKGDYNVENGVLILGDIIISAEKALEQSVEFGHSLYREIAFLVAHGMLHLLGYDHSNELERELMHNKEENVLDNIGLSRKC